MINPFDFSWLRSTESKIAAEKQKQKALQALLALERQKKATLKLQSELEEAQNGHEFLDEEPEFPRVQSHTPVWNTPRRRPLVVPPPKENPEAQARIEEARVRREARSNAQKKAGKAKPVKPIDPFKKISDIEAGPPA